MKLKKIPRGSASIFANCSRVGNRTKLPVRHFIYCACAVVRRALHGAPTALSSAQFTQSKIMMSGRMFKKPLRFKTEKKPAEIIKCDFLSRSFPVSFFAAFVMMIRSYKWPFHYAFVAKSAQLTDKRFGFQACIMSEAVGASDPIWATKGCGKRVFCFISGELMDFPKY